MTFWTWIIKITDQLRENSSSKKLKKENLKKIRNNFPGKKKILKKIYKIQNIGHFSNLLSEKQLHLFIRKYSDFLSIDFS